MFELDAGLVLPADGVRHIAGVHADRGVVIGDVVDRIPLVIGQEDVVDIEAEVVARGPEVDATGHPAEDAVAQQLVMALELVACDGVDHLLGAVRTDVDAQEGRAAGAGEQRAELRSFGGGGRGAVPEDRSRCQRHGTLEGGERGLALSGELRRGAALLGARGGSRQAVGGVGIDVVAELADPEGLLQLGQDRLVACRQVGVGRDDDDRLVEGAVGRVVGDLRVRQRLGRPKAASRRARRRARARSSRRRRRRPTSTGRSAGPSCRLVARAAAVRGPRRTRPVPPRAGSRSASPAAGTCASVLPWAGVPLADVLSAALPARALLEPRCRLPYSFTFPPSAYAPTVQRK